MIRFVLPDSLVCRPAVIMTTWPRRPKPPASRRSFASRTTSSKLSQVWPSTGHTPQVSPSWFTTRRLGLTATIGSEGRLCATARAVAPVYVALTMAAASTRLATSQAP